MTPQRWRKIEEIFQAALDLEGEARARFVDRECAGDRDLRAEVDKFIARFETEDSFLESPAWTDSRFLQTKLKNEIAASLDETSSAEPAETFIGRQIGAYQLTEELGRGGMGVVYLAERADGEFRQRVAIKLIKRGMDTDFILRRFRQERQIAATLNHPNIARLLDGGTTADDLPYFVMEYIDGLPFFKYAATHQLDLRAKLELFLEVCAAIAYAHKKRIIHRDIKPGNILVTEDGEPKLLDFGIAKILDPDLIHETAMPTATQMRLMTPEYASPEQVRGDEITPASDQYSLGVLLYELLTGSRPYKFPSRAPHEIARIICEEIPSGPSSGSFGKIMTESAGLSFSGEDFCQKLDRIVLKILKKNPSERYSSVREMSADLERFLRGEPLSAESQAIDSRSSVPSPHQTAKLASVSLNQKSVAVLPFKNLRTFSGAEAGDSGDYLNIGLADALITRLSNLRQFVVRPTSSVLRFGGQENDSFAAGRELSVAFVLDGHILQTGQRIRVSIQLLDVAEQSTVWAERFDEEMTDVLSLEDTISKRVAESLVPQLSTGEVQNLAKRATDRPEAYEAYLRGRYHWNTFSEEGFQKAFAYYSRAIELDPDYALAYAGIADYYLWLGIFGALSPKKCYPLAKTAARRAIDLDPQLAEAYAAAGFAALCGDFDWAGSEKSLRRAVELNPNYAAGHNLLALRLFADGRFKEGIGHTRQAIRLDPLTFQNQRTLFWGLYFARQYEEAVKQSDQTVRDFPRYEMAYANRSWLLRAVGRTAESLQDAEKALTLAYGSRFVSVRHAQALAAAGQRAEAESILAGVEAEPAENYISYYQVALVYCYLKEQGKALDALERAFSDGDGWLVWTAVEPAFDWLREDERYHKLLQKINYPAAATSNISDPPLPSPSATAQMVTGEQKTTAASEAETVIQMGHLRKKKLAAPLKYLLAAFLLVGCGSVVYLLTSFTTFSFSLNAPAPVKDWRSSFASLMNIRRLTTPGRTASAVISPDGKSIAYVTEEGAVQSLRLRSAEGSDERELISVENVSIEGPVFSPDGAEIYYLVLNEEQNTSVLFRISVTPGAAPEKISENVAEAIAFAPDGRRIAFFGYEPATKTVSLNIAEFDDNQKLKPPVTLRSLVYPAYFGGTPAFSPDGEKIAYVSAVSTVYQPNAQFSILDLQTDREERLTTKSFYSVSALAWRTEGGTEIIAAADETRNSSQQLWLIDYRSGAISPLTNDLTNYDGVSLSKNSTSLLTVRRETSSNILVADLEKDPSPATTVRQLTTGTERQDGLKGLQWMPDGEILYAAGNSAETVLKITDETGSRNSTVNLGDVRPVHPLWTSDKRYLFFYDAKKDHSTLWRFDTTNGNLKQITDGDTVAPSLTPDDKNLLYSAVDQSGWITLHSVSVDGGQSVRLADGFTARAVASPDNRLIACYYNGAETDHRWRIVILNRTGGALLKIVETPENDSLQAPPERPLAWSADNRSLYYLTDRGGISNIFRIRIDGRQPPDQLTHFTSGRIFAFSIAPGEKRVALARGSMSSNIVIFSSSSR